MPDSVSSVLPRGRKQVAPAHRRQWHVDLAGVLRNDCRHRLRLERNQQRPVRLALPPTLGAWHSLGVPEKANDRPLVLREHAVRSCLEDLNGVDGGLVRGLHAQLFWWRASNPRNIRRTTRAMSFNCSSGMLISMNGAGGCCSKYFMAARAASRRVAPGGSSSQ